MLGGWHLLRKALERDRGGIAQGRMAALAVVPDDDVLEDRPLRCRSGRPGLAMEQFDFERREKALRHRVIEAIADSAGRRQDARRLQPLPEGQGGVLTAAIGVMNEARGRAPTLEGQVEGGED